MHFLSVHYSQQLQVSGRYWRQISGYGGPNFCLRHECIEYERKCSPSFQVRVCLPLKFLLILMKGPSEKSLLHGSLHCTVVSAEQKS
jgi:hypothetical protein